MTATFMRGTPGGIEGESQASINDAGPLHEASWRSRATTGSAQTFGDRGDEVHHRTAQRPGVVPVAAWKEGSHGWRADRPCAADSSRRSTRACTESKPAFT